MSTAEAERRAGGLASSVNIVADIRDFVVKIIAASTDEEEGAEEERDGLARLSGLLCALVDRAADSLLRAAPAHTRPNGAAGLARPGRGYAVDCCRGPLLCP